MLKWCQRASIERPMLGCLPLYPSCMESEYLTPAEVAAILKLSRQTIIRHFENMPGVLKIGHGESRFARRHWTLRIPRSALERFIVQHGVR
jgi:hypothetical protein